jgi:hypothetical protein
MAKLQKGNTIYPFWGEHLTLITGLDPLGLQLTSEATYATLLPGISNLTNRLRYYGFYCWLIDFYFQKENKVSQTEQFRFIRRAELLIAIIMQIERKHITQITGSEFASYLINEETTEFDLKKGADQSHTDSKVYWKYPSGAFGQYYFGALKALNLVQRYENTVHDVIFNITEPNEKQKVSGRALADAFDVTLNDTIKTIFYKAIKTGKLLRRDVTDLVNFFEINTIKPNSLEWQLYVNMLLDKDYPSEITEERYSFNRRDTIKALLSMTEYSWYNYLNDCYKQKINETEPANTGWYCYMLNEHWQFACGSIFQAILCHLQAAHSPVYLPKFITDFTNLIIKELDLDTAEQLKNYISNLSELEYEFLGQLKNEETPEELAKNAILLLLTLYKNNETHLSELKKYMNRHGISRDGNMVDGLLEINNQLDLPIFDFIRTFIHKKIISRHQMVALRKMGNGTQSTHKFIIEEQMIRLIETFPARSTSPRMETLRRLLQDLGVIDNAFTITDLASKLTNI